MITSQLKIAGLVMALLMVLLAGCSTPPTSRTVIYNDPLGGCVVYGTEGNSSFQIRCKTFNFVNVDEDWFGLSCFPYTAYVGFEHPPIYDNETVDVEYTYNEHSQVGVWMWDNSEGFAYTSSEDIVLDFLKVLETEVPIEFKIEGKSGEVFDSWSMPVFFDYFFGKL